MRSEEPPTGPMEIASDDASTAAELVPSAETDLPLNTSRVLRLRGGRRVGTTVVLNTIPPDQNAPRGSTTSDADALPVPRPWWRRLDVADLDLWDCEPLRPIIDGILARGNFASLVAETQTGKTLLGLYLARKILDEGSLFGRFAITPVERVAYYALEDPARRIQERLRDTAHEFPAVDRGRLIFRCAPGFSLSDARMWSWFETCIVEDGPDVVFIDTYQKATPGLNSFDDAAQSPLLHKLADLTRQTGITIIVIDHVRKRAANARRGGITIDDLKGTGGKAQNCDVVILMERTPNREGIIFQSFAKDFDLPIRVVLRVAPRGSREIKFLYIEDLRSPSSRGLGRPRAVSREDTLAALPLPGDWVSAVDVAGNLKVSPSTISRSLRSLVAEGHVIDNAKKGRWKMYSRTKTSADGDSAGRAMTP
jgi:DNA-binding transcriptional ArsR family regulator